MLFNEPTGEKFDEKLAAFAPNVKCGSFSDVAEEAGADIQEMANIAAKELDAIFPGSGDALRRSRSMTVPGNEGGYAPRRTRSMSVARGPGGRYRQPLPPFPYTIAPTDNSLCSQDAKEDKMTGSKSAATSKTEPSPAAPLPGRDEIAMQSQPTGPEYTEAVEAMPGQSK